MSRATVARGLRLLASWVAGDDPVADTIREAVEARRVAAEALRVAHAARVAAAHPAAAMDAARIEARDAAALAGRTRDVVRAWLREGVDGAERAAEAANQSPMFRGERPVAVGPLPLSPPTVERARALLRDLAGEG